MSIISFIGRETPDPEAPDAPAGVEHVYCHGGGRPWVNGATLLVHYGDPDKVERLIALGDLSSLGRDIGRRVSFDAARDNPELRERQCVAYRRDRDERDRTTRHAASALAFLKTADKHAARVCYLYREGRWHLQELPRDNLVRRREENFEPLTALHCVNPELRDEVRDLLEWCRLNNGNGTPDPQRLHRELQRYTLSRGPEDGAASRRRRRLAAWLRTLAADPVHAGRSASALLALLPEPEER